MFGFGWLKLRKVRAALAAGRVEEAETLLRRAPCRSTHADRLRTELANTYISQAEKQLAEHDLLTAWLDWQRADRLQAALPCHERLRWQLLEASVAQLRSLCEQNEPIKAVLFAQQLHERNVQASEIDAIRSAGRAWLQAQEHASKGEYPQACTLLERARAELPFECPPVVHYLAELREQQDQCTPMLCQLFESAQENRWGEVYALTERVLQFAPRHAEALQLRARAWQSVLPDTVLAPPSRSAEPVQSEPTETTKHERFLLWLDGAGSYLVCLGASVTLGQAVADCPIDIPLLADVSRLHASLTRDDEGYLLEAQRKTLVNGQLVERTLLQSGDRLTLGASCQLLFTKAVSASGSAKLTMMSGHRFPLSVDGVLLMADTLVLGQEGHAHVTLPELKAPLVLVRQKEGLGLRYRGKLLVEGQPHEGRALLQSYARCQADDIAFTIEPIDRLSATAMSGHR